MLYDLVSKNNHEYGYYISTFESSSFNHFFVLQNRRHSKNIMKKKCKKVFSFSSGTKRKFRSCEEKGVYYNLFGIPI